MGGPSGKFNSENLEQLRIKHDSSVSQQEMAVLWRKRYAGGLAILFVWSKCLNFVLLFQVQRAITTSVEN